MIWMGTEAEEVAANMPINGIVTQEDAMRAVTASMGPPGEVGFQMFDNVVEALFERANACRPDRNAP